MAKRILVFVVSVALIVGAIFAVRFAQVRAHEQAVVSVRESVLNAAKQCCAVEGSYPASLSYLEHEYGLVINHEDYVVSYEWFADNVLPSVVVTAR
jgi:hypothetical protein